MQQLATELIGMIETAHHKDDSKETILFKLLRGIHISNITGLSIIQQCPNAASAITGSVFDNVDDEYGTNMGIRNNGTLIYWVRPLLNVRKQELVRYLQQNNFTWREDISNQSNKYLRNRIRNEFFPLLHDILQNDDNPSSKANDVQITYNSKHRTFEMTCANESRCTSLKTLKMIYQKNYPLPIRWERHPSNGSNSVKTCYQC